MMEWRNGNYRVSDDPTELDVNLIHGFLSEKAYWSIGRTREVVEKSIERSLCFGLFRAESQIGFARVITDYATFAYLCDVFVLEELRNQGLGQFLVECIMMHPSLRGVHFLLKTTYSQSLYKRFGFEEISPTGWMQRSSANNRPCVKSGFNGKIMASV